MLVRWLYWAITFFLGPFILVLLQQRKKRGKENPLRISERRGVASLERPPGLLIWIHAASVGESQSILPLAAHFQNMEGVIVLVTTGSVTSAQLMADRLPSGACHQFVPVDHPLWVNRFLNHWRPDMALWVESEFWPNLMEAAAHRQIPMGLINARVTEKSFNEWLKAPKFAKRLISNFSLSITQDKNTATRLRTLGAEHVIESGNLRYSADPLPVDENELMALKDRCAGRPILLAASTHCVDGVSEENIALNVHRRLCARSPGLLSVIVPRHPERGDQLALDLRAQGFVVAQRSKGDPLLTDTQVYLADTLGELGLFFRLCPVVFLGGSFVDIGGHNPLEPLMLGATLVHGPSCFNHGELYQDMHKLEAALMVSDEAQLFVALGDMLNNPGEAQEIARAGLSYANSKTHVFEQVTTALQPLMDRAKQRLEALP
jgi:3-deoxy-D-manno-octulosonic-acid transferase